jgi:hypothetical protein
MLKKYPFLLFLLILVFSAFTHLVFPISNSYVSAKLLITGTKEEFIKNSFLQQDFDGDNKINSLFFRGIVYEAGYSDRFSDDSNAITKLDYRLVLFREILFSLFPILMFLLISIIVFKFSSQNKIYSRLLSGIGIVISAFSLNLIIYEQFNSAALFFPKTVEYFFPLKVQPEHDTYFSNGIVIIAAIIIFSLLFAASYRNDWQHKLQSIFFGGQK